MNFFTRLDCMTLRPGNKSAGFLLSVATQALVQLGGLSISDDEWDRLVKNALQRVLNSGLLSAEQVSDCGLERYQGTAVPRTFWVNRMFACSIGAAPEWLPYVQDPEMAQRFGSEVDYSPHNVDVPKHALVLMILVQTWTEWAWGKLIPLAPT